MDCTRSPGLHAINCGPLFPKTLSGVLLEASSQVPALRTKNQATLPLLSHFKRILLIKYENTYIMFKEKWKVFEETILTYD